MYNKNVSDWDLAGQKKKAPNGMHKSLCVHVLNFV